VALAGEGVFQKIGDGWKKGHWLPGLDWPGKDQPQQPQSKPSSPPTRVGELYQITYRVDCRDRQTGRDAGDETLTITSPHSYPHAEALARSEVENRNVCFNPAWGDRDRVMVPGSGRTL
jgi:hypothetical protein